MVAKQSILSAEQNHIRKNVVVPFLARFISQGVRQLKWICTEGKDHTKKDVLYMKMRTRGKHMCTFNLKSFLDHITLQNFRFTRTDLPKIADLLHLQGGLTNRRRYKLDKMTFCFIVLKRLSSPCHWVVLERIFGIQSPKLSEVFWEVKEKFSHLVTDLWTELLR